MNLRRQNTTYKNPEHCFVASFFWSIIPVFSPRTCDQIVAQRKTFVAGWRNCCEKTLDKDSTSFDVYFDFSLTWALSLCWQRKDYSALVPFLPRKHEYVIKVRLSMSQRKLYEHYLKTFVFPEGDVCKRGEETLVQEGMLCSQGKKMIVWYIWKEVWKSIGSMRTSKIW